MYNICAATTPAFGHPSFIRRGVLHAP